MNYLFKILFDNAEEYNCLVDNFEVNINETTPTLFVNSKYNNEAIASLQKLTSLKVAKVEFFTENEEALYSEAIWEKIANINIRYDSFSKQMCLRFVIN